MMKVLFWIWVSYFVLSVVRSIARRRRERKRREQYQLLLHQQQEMLRKLVGVDFDPAPTLANVAAEEQSSRWVNIGWNVLWIVLFVGVAFFAFYVLQPWIRALAILGWKDFWRMITL
jgi:hypothetical protein